MSRCRPYTVIPSATADRLNREYPAPDGWSGWGIEPEHGGRILSRRGGYLIVWMPMERFIVLRETGERHEKSGRPIVEACAGRTLATPNEAREWVETHQP